MSFARWLPASLARRFALAAAGLATVALLLTSLASWWLINRQQDHAVRQLALLETESRAASVGSDLSALAARMVEVAGSTILATGLVDSVGRETYLQPFLDGIRQVNGIPVKVMFTDFEGKEIASNAGSRFSEEQKAWLGGVLAAGRPAAQIFAAEAGHELVAAQPMVYARTPSPEGAILYKFLLKDINAGSGVTLQWGPAVHDTGLVVSVPSPAIFAPLQFRVRSTEQVAGRIAGLRLPFLHVLAIALGIFAAVVVAGMRLARLLTSDLRSLEVFSSRLVGSDLGTERAREAGSTEVASLARSINDMLERLNQQHSALLNEREKLTHLTDALQAADRRKDDFLAMLGHELRNPLAPISTGAQLLRRIPRADPLVVRTSDIIVRQVAHMTKLISDLLDVSRVTRGLITLDRSEVDMTEVVDAAIEQVRPLLESRQHQLTASMPPEVAMVEGDHDRLLQIIGNLLTNAAKYTPQGGQVAVSLDTTPSQVIVRVKDTGIGITPELLPHVFDLFTQGSRSIDRRQGGLGLGLALVKHLVGLHGGEVQATSAGANQGAEFTVRLPRIATDRRPDPAPSDAVPAPLPAARMKVLVVDDNVDAAQTLAEWLACEGHQVCVAHDGPSALDLAARERPHACILDIGLPGMDGMELARQLRQRPHSAQTWLVALTGYGQQADRDNSATAGFDEHFIKPVEADDLRASLATVQRRLDGAASSPETQDTAVCQALPGLPGHR